MSKIEQSRKQIAIELSRVPENMDDFVNDFANLLGVPVSEISVVDIFDKPRDIEILLESPSISDVNNTFTEGL